MPDKNKKQTSPYIAIATILAVALLVIKTVADSSDATRAENEVEHTQTPEQIEEVNQGYTFDLLREARENSDSLNLEAQRAYITSGYDGASDQDQDNYNDAYFYLTEKIDSTKQANAKLTP